MRNVFAFHVPPTPTPRPLPPTPTPLPVPGSAEFVGPRPPTPTPTPTPLVPPAIPFRALGIFGPRERPIVTFEDGPRLINAREGDVLDGRFIRLMLAPAKGPARLMTAGLGLVTGALTKVLGAQVLTGDR